MLFSLSKQSPLAPRFQKALQKFVKNAQKDVAAFSETLFPPWFRPVLLAGNKNKGLWPKCEKVFEEIQKLRTPRRKEFFAVFQNHNRIEELCYTPTLRLRVLASFPQSLIDAFSELTEHLFNGTLSLGAACGMALGFPEPCIPWHFKKIRQKYIVCPFCGLMAYPAIGKERAAYDHYLHRRIYPLSAANGANLIPMCERCNSPSNKGQKDVLRKNRARRRVFYPYDECSGVDVAGRCVEPDKLTRRALWKVEIASRTPVKEGDQVRTWLDVFRIKERYEELLFTDSWVWIEREILDWRKTNDNGGIGSLRQHLRGRATSLQGEIETTEKAIVIQAALAHVAQVNRIVLDSLIVGADSDYGKTTRARGRAFFGRS
jgi:hypothetical protein